MAGGLFEKRTRGTATTEVHHIQVQGRAVAVYTSLSSTTQSIRYLHGDHLGSIVLVTDEDGDVEGSRYSFDAFGRRRNGANWTDTLTTLTNPDTTRGYTGHEMLDTVDIVHMNGRIYDPFLGRVLSPDPIVQAPFDMQSFNRYTYVFNNPLSLTDPSGFLADDGYYVFDSGWTVDVVFHPGADGLGTFEVIRGIATRATWVSGSGNRGGRQGGGVGGGCHCRSNTPQSVQLQGFYMDTARLPRLICGHGLQVAVLYSASLYRTCLPAGPDGIRRSASHSLHGLFAPNPTTRLGGSRSYLLTITSFHTWRNLWTLSFPNQSFKLNPAASG